MKCPTCGGDAELLKQPCCETAWADHVVSHPSDAVAALQRADYDGAIKLGLDQLAVAWGVVTAAKLARGDGEEDSLTISSKCPRAQKLVEKLRASIGRTPGAGLSADEQHTISTEGRLALGWRDRLRAALLGYLDIAIAVRTERLAGRSSWRWRVVD